MSQAADTAVSIIPEPVTVTRGSGYFALPDQISISYPVMPELKSAMTGFENKLKATGKTVSPAAATGAGTFRFLLNKAADKTLGNEGYQLEVTTAGVTVKANKPAGFFYAVQTILQLLPKEIESAGPVGGVNWQIPVVAVTDYPRFVWRGLMLDVARHFFTKKDVLDFIDNMSRYKFNLLHMHLTDDEGWRIEIKSLPRLTTVGAFSAKRVGTFGTFAEPAPDEPKTSGGFYTQEDMKEIIAYAKDRFIDIMPEVDVPGHSMAAIVAYPDLSCTAGADKYQVISGENFMDWTDKGPMALRDNTLCPANDKVYTFLDKVFTELAQIFPFPYIHIGGDEVPKNLWAKSDAINALMAKEKLTTYQEVQSYFEKRVTKIVESKKKKVLGWDEILEGGVPASALVMSWRGIDGGIKAAKMGHQVVMSPTTYVYLDYMQGDASYEPPVYATLRLNKTYQFEPVPDSVDAKFILGGQANMWTEQVYNTRHLQYMIWPRSLAVAESVWSPKAAKNWDKFAAKVEHNFPRMDIENVKYATTLYDAIVDAKKDDKDSLIVNLSTEIKGLDIYYSWDNSHPDNFYEKYSSPLSLPKEPALLRVITYRGTQPIGREISIPVVELKKRAGIGK